MNLENYLKEKGELLQKRIKKVCSFVREESYYPELTRKSSVQRLCDNLWWIMRYGEVNGKYNLYGMDVIERQPLYNDYVDYKSFRRIRNNQNYIRKNHPQTCLLRDKYLFAQYMNKMGIPAAEVFAVQMDGKLYDSQLRQITLDEIKEKKDYFAKEINGECASFIKHIADHSELISCYDEIKEKHLIFQDRLIQCEKMNCLNPTSVNTMRTVTIRKDGEVIVFASEIRIGTTESGIVDNAAAGGILVGVTEDGSLREYGIIKPGHSKITRIKKHPDTGIVFGGFKIPYYQDAMKLVVRAHSALYDVKSIGWDVAFTENGPVLIEGNDNWEITGLQACNGGLKKKWIELAIKKEN